MTEGVRPARFPPGADAEMSDETQVRPLRHRARRASPPMHGLWDSARCRTRRARAPRARPTRALTHQQREKLPDVPQAAARGLRETRQAARAAAHSAHMTCPGTADETGDTEPPAG